MEQNVLNFLKLFTSIIWEAFPFIVLGALIAGILEEVVPQQAISKIVPKNRFLAVALGGVLGLVFPMCECGIVPVMRRLLRKGLPLGTCVSYMMAGPIINVVVISTTIIAFEGFGLAEAMTTLRVGLGFLVAFITGLIVEYQYRKYGGSLLNPVARPEKSLELGLVDAAATPDVHPAELRAGNKQPIAQRIGNIAETALHDFKDIMVFLTIGAMIASLARFWIDDNQLKEVSTNLPAVTILVMMGLAIVMCLCSEADAFVAASFGTNLHVSAKLAFLVLGPMFDFKLLMMFTRVFRKRLIVTIILSAVIQVFVYTLIVHYTWEYVKKVKERNGQSETSAQVVSP
jgi:uncharacterized membrane protein YraQ (UPF0718 family)